MYNPAHNVAATSMEFVRGPQIDHGGFASIHLAKPFNDEFSHFPPLIVVKSCESSTSMSLKNEGEVLSHFKNCPEVVQCFGDNYTTEDGVELHNLMLEYAEAGNLASKAGILSESHVRFYTRSILRGIRCIHSKGYVHCDIKLRNVLVFGGGDTVKIADFGLAKKTGEVRNDGVEFRGTPMYIAPESVNRNEYGPPCDVWALGCAVVEMITGKPAWKCEKYGEFYGLMLRIGAGDELPEVPEELCEAGKDFLRKCFVKDPRDRWTAEMLLDHPFVAAQTQPDGLGFVKEGIEFPKFDSPRDPFEFGNWDSNGSSSMLWIGDEVSSTSILIQSSSQSSASERLRELAKQEAPSWVSSESWITVR